MPTLWVRYQVREVCNDGTRKFIPHHATDRDTGINNYNQKDIESARHYARSLGVPAFIVKITEEPIEQF